MAYDIIGDIHGQADKLHGLLRALGYRETGGAWRHPSRTAIFVGDYIDRGPRQLDSVTTVRRMVNVGSALAIMGNHEFNAIAWHTDDPAHSGEYLRPRGGKWGEKNRDQHKVFLSEVEHKPTLHAELIEWFLTLPLWLDLPGLRVVHACWHDGYMNELLPHLTADFKVPPDLMVAASREGQMAFRTIEGLTKGLEIALPDGHSFEDKDGHIRHNVRIRWWDTEASTYRELAMMSDAARLALPAIPIENDARSVYDNAKPVFFGHYWMKGMPVLQSPMAACLDYSAATNGPLVAYRWDGESLLDARNFVAVG